VGCLVTWFKVDDRLPTHRKVLSIPRGARRVAAIGAWTLCGAWVSGNGNDGHVPAHVLDDFGIPARAAADLVSCGMWKVSEDGYVIHDYLDYNPTGEQIANDRAAAAERQRRAREKAASRRDSRVTHADVTPPVTDPRHGPPDPTRPDPKEQTPSVSVAAPKHPIPENWRPTAEDEAWAKAECPLVNVGRETASFVDFFLDKGEKRPGWTRSWKRWMREAQERTEKRRPLRAVGHDPQYDWDV
jgi:hypothetical protein